MSQKNLYNEHSIVSETAREFTRRVPATYLGSAKTNSNLLKEVFANSVDEYVIGHGNVINVKINTKDNVYQVEDFGQGFLVNSGIDEEGETILQRCFDKINTSGKTSEDGVYSGTSLGLNGIGAKLTNWLSLKLHVITYRDGQSEAIWFKDGIFVKREVKEIKRVSGTIVTWSPDPQFFRTNEPDIDALKTYFEEIAALCPTLTINVEYNGKTMVFSEPDGLNALMNKRVAGKELFTNRFVFERQLGKDKLNICLTYTSDYTESINAYVNLGYTDGGAHFTGFRTAFVRAINKYATDTGLLKKSDKNLNSAEISEGLCVIFNMTTTTARYDAQSKSRIDDIDNTIINNVIGGDFATWLINNPNEAKIIIERALNARKAREAAQKAKEKIREAGKTDKKNLFADLPSKLSDAYPRDRKDRSKCELMICLKGDTKIKLLNGTDPTIESLVDKSNIWAYSTDEHGAMIPAKITNVFKTQEVTDMIKLTFDDGSIVECTPEHKFLDRDTCTWIEAKDLVIGQSMFSMKFKNLEPIDNKRPKVWIPMTYTKYNSKTRKIQGHWEDVHIRVAKLLGIAHDYDGILMDIHHNDLNKQNNDPSNLRFLTKKEHLAIHNRINHDTGIMDYNNKHFTEESRKRMQTAVYNRSVEGINRQRAAVSNAWKNGYYKNATWERYNSNKRFDKNGHDITQVNKVLKIVKIMLNNGLTINEENYNTFKLTINKSAATYKKALTYFDNYEQLIESAKNYNLQITNIEYIHYNTPIPVYCLNIDNSFHSFVLSNGLITHNCEGDSAASSINATKNSEFQACYPIRGKILNCQKATPDKVYGNAEIANITKALGLDIDKSTGKLVYNEKKLRYNKIIITTDEDIDGYAISSLLLTVFNWLCPELIENGHIYRVHGALFKATFNDKTYKLFQTEAELDAWKKTNTKSYTLSRAKGLGELTKEETYEQLINPATRNLHQLVANDMNLFNEYLEMFEGADVGPRKDYLEEHFNDYHE